MEKLVHKGKVSEMSVNDKVALYFDMPHKPEDAILSFGIETLIPLQEIFTPYIGKSITITLEKEAGKVRKITIIEEKD